MFRDEAKTEQVAWVKLRDYDEGDYIYIQHSDAEDAWDYTLYDDEHGELDGGQFDLPGVDNAFDALFEILDDIDEEDAKFLDPEDYEDII